MTQYASRTVPDELIVAGQQLRGFSSLPPDEAFTFHQRLVESAHDCGCRLGGMAASLALSLYLVLTIALPLIGGTPVTFSWWKALAALLGGALVGKTLGVFRAKRRFDAALRDFEARRAPAAR